MPTILKTKNSVTTTVAPTTLAQGELAVNITDKKMWVGNAATTPVQILGAGTTGTAAGSNTQVQYNSSGTLAGDADFTFNGTTVTMANDASISGLTVGKGLGSVGSNTAFGVTALASNTSGTSNTAIGDRALNANTSGIENTGVGGVALLSNTTGNYNHAFGRTALPYNTTGSSNTALGYASLFSNTTASNNTAVGYQAGYSNTTGTIITAIGRQALYNNTTGTDNTALGYAMVSNTTGSQNTGIGAAALNANTTATRNTAVGYRAGIALTTGGANVIMGDNALQAGTTADNNVAIGTYALADATGQNSTAVGSGAGSLITSGAKNTIIGRYNGNQGGLDIRTSSNNIVLSDGDGTPRAWCRVGASGWKFTDNGTVDNISDQMNEFYSSTNSRCLNLTSSNASLTTDGLLFAVANRNTTNNTFYAFSYYNVGAGLYRFRIADSGNATNTNNSYGGISDVKLKENIVDATPKLEDLCKVKVRQYNLKSDPNHKQIGVIAQELEEVFAGLVEETKDTDKDNNDLGTTTKQVKYSVFVPMLIKAVQELNAKLEAQALEIAQLKGN